MNQRLRTIRLLTERYSELQGLRVAFAGGLVAAVCGAVLIAAPEPDVQVVNLALLAAFGAYLVAHLLLARYYRSRYGRIAAPRSRAASGWFAVALVAVITILDNTFSTGPFAGLLVVGAVSALWVVVRDFPMRSYYLLGIVGSSLGATLMLMAAGTPQLGRAQALGMFVFGLAYIPIGLLDHRLLSSVMRSPGEGAGLTTSAEAPAVKKSCATGERERE